MGNFETLITASETLATSQPRLTEMQRAQKLHAKPYRNASGGAQTVFSVIRHSGIDAGTDLPTAVLAAAADSFRVYGIIVAEDGGGETTVANNQTGFYVDEGFVSGLNTSGFSANDLLWVHASTPGSFQNTPVDGQQPVAFVENAAAAPNGRIYFNRNGVGPGTVGAATLYTATKQLSLYLGTISASGDRFLMCTRGRVRITQVSLTVDANTTDNGTDFWSIQIRNLTAANNLLSAAFSSNGNSFVADTAKDLTPNQNQTITTENSMIELQITKNGAATNLGNLLVNVEYQNV